MDKKKIMLGVLLFAAHLSAAADVMDDAAAKMLKMSLKEVCEDDKECTSAVDEQFDACLAKSDFLKYMNASAADEDKYLDSTFKFLYTCIVDEGGNPYFEAPEA